MSLACQTITVIFFVISVCAKKDDDSILRRKDLGAFVTELIVDYGCIVVPYILVMTVSDSDLQGFFTLRLYCEVP